MTAFLVGSTVRTRSSLWLQTADTRNTLVPLRVTVTSSLPAVGETKRT